MPQRTESRAVAAAEYPPSPMIGRDLRSAGNNGVA
jgi:hypothetical protein